MKLANSLDAEQRRAAEEGLSDDEYVLFQLLFKDNLSRADREKLKQASKSLLASLRELLQRMPAWTKNSQTQAEVKVLVLDTLVAKLATAAIYGPRGRTAGRSDLRLCVAAKHERGVSS